ncbi:hypothetical protein QYF36_005245 [Acer negundo]|nr:hypothetical protein QYF36_005245 [Acer negundo]
MNALFSKRIKEAGLPLKFKMPSETKLPPGSVDSFSKLTTAFCAQFQGIKPRPKDPILLYFVVLRFVCLDIRISDYVNVSYGYLARGSLERGTWLIVEAGYLVDVVYVCLSDAVARYPADVMVGYPIDISSRMPVWCNSRVENSSLVLCRFWRLTEVPLNLNTDVLSGLELGFYLSLKDFLPCLRGREEGNTVRSSFSAQRRRSTRNLRIGSGFNNKPNNPVELADEEVEEDEDDDDDEEEGIPTGIPLRHYFHPFEKWGKGKISEESQGILEKILGRHYVNVTYPVSNPFDSGRVDRYLKISLAAPSSPSIMYPAVILPTAPFVSSSPSSVSPTTNVGISLRSSWPTDTPPLTPAKSRTSPPAKHSTPPTARSPLRKIAARASRGKGNWYLGDQPSSSQTWDKNLEEAEKARDKALADLARLERTLDTETLRSLRRQEERDSLKSEKVLLRDENQLLRGSIGNLEVKIDNDFGDGYFYASYEVAKAFPSLLDLMASLGWD